MPSPSWEDLSVFFQAEERGGFAIPAAFTLSDGSIRTVMVIYDDPQFDAQLGTYVREDSEYRVTGKAVDLEGVERGDYCVVAGKTFDVISSARPDGTGTAYVSLAEPAE